MFDFNTIGVYTHALDLFERRQYDVAIEILGKAIHDYPNSSDLYNLLGSCYSNLDEMDNSIKSYLKAIAIQTDSMYILNLSKAYYKIGKYSDSIDLINEYITSEINDSGMYYQQGKNFLAIYEYNSALKMFQKASEADNTSHEIYYQIGYTYLKMNQPDLAIIAFNKSSDLGNFGAKAMIQKIQFENTK